MPPQISPLFAVPFARARIDASEILNHRLRSLFLERERQGERHANRDAYKVHGKGLFESHFRLFDDPDPAVARLRDFCWSQLYHVIGELNGYDLPVLRRLHLASESWFHVTRRGGSFDIHNHPMHSWSGVYCVCQEGDDPASDSGRFTAINPQMGSNAYLDMATFKLRGPYSGAKVALRLEPGELLIFPSWLPHYVTPFEPASTDDVRITVAFNARFRLDGYRHGQQVA